MVLGVIMYEAFDIAYNLGRMVVGGGRYLYHWYYAIDDTTTNDARIEMLMRRIEVLEKNMLLEDKRDDQNMNSN